MSSSHHRLTRSRTIATILLSLSLTLLPYAGFTMRVQAQSRANTDSGVHFGRATVGARGVLIEWSSSDTNNLGFNIYRTQAGQRTLINGGVTGGGLFPCGKHLGPHPDCS